PTNAVDIRGVLADSNNWEIVPRTIPAQVPGSPHTVQSLTAVEQPRPPFSAYQGEAWSYIGEVVGVAAFTGTCQSGSPSGTDLSTAPTQRVTLPSGATLDFPARQALVPKRHLLAGRAISDGVLTAHPSWATNPRTSPD